MGYSHTPEERAALEVLIPELAESEDERHRKWILEYLYDGLRKTDEQFKDHFKAAIAYLEKQKAKNSYDRMAPIYENKESFESALDKAWRFYNDSGSSTVDGCEDNSMELAFAKGFREGFLYGEQKVQNPALVEIDNSRENIVFPFNATVKSSGKSVTIIDGKLGIDAKQWVKFCSNTIDGFKVYNPEELLIQMKEQKPVEPNWIHHKVDLSDCSEEYIKAYYDGWNNCNQQHAQHYAEQKPAEWSEEDEKMKESIIKALYGGGHFAYEPEITWLKSLPERFNQNKKWSEEDSKMLHDIEGYVTGTGSSSGITKKERSEWLWSLPRRFNLLSKQEWSKEDEVKLNDVIRMIENSGNVKSIIKHYTDFLKSLRPSWKPSEEQMGALNYAYCELFKRKDVGHNILGSLQKLIDQLREQM